MANSEISPQTAAITCAENVAVLSLLYPTSSPSSNIPADRHIQQTGYALPLDREKVLVGMLAYLAHTDDNPNTIPAICIEEVPKAACLRVLLAVNKAREESNKKILDNLQKRFDELFALLAKVDDGPSDIEESLSATIVSMCSSRILSRMRLIPNYKNQKKPPIKERLQVVINRLREVARTNPKTPELLISIESFTKEAESVIRLIDEWEKDQTPSHLKSLVHGVHTLWTSGKIHGELMNVPTDVLCPSSREALMDSLFKVARYREAAGLLYRTAKEFPLARRMQIMPIELPKHAFDKVPTDKMKVKNYLAV
ncbi:hypothetical protein SLS62_004652 [Diatrype stigma]|uniref:Uncharacterized protein n=1 Tax=Diatrype stigma TaxID=117547 RepID=A0AAN9YSW8_9PEZI